MSVPPTPTTEKSTPAREAFIPLVAVVDFHHARGPEVERWFGVEEGRDPAAEYDWTLLPFMALSDGAHALTEDFSYFTLLRPATESAPATSLFGISCTRQMDASELLNRPADVTRSTVQKAVVVIADSPQAFGMLRERLSVVTQAWFAQRDFTDVEILRRFQDSLADEKKRGMAHEDEERDQYLGLSLRELVREFRWQTLVLFKCCLLQPKMLFFGSRCERLCLTQFSLVSLIPRLLHNLQDSAGPELDSYERSLTMPTSLRTSDRNSLLSYMGLPLQIFGKGSLFGPYTPLQQLDILADFGTKSYIVGSTNSLLLQQKDRYSDILINLDEGTINVTSPSLKAALQLSTPDRRWIDFITQNVNDTWDEANPSRPKTMGYVGSEEFIRVQFEEYLLALISSVKYRAHLARHANNPRMLLPDIDGDPSHDFGNDFVEAWSRTQNFRIWNSHTDSHLFDIVEPKHPCAGGLTIEDIQRRITQQVQDMHWDERFAQGREALGRNLAAGREKASTLFGKLYADMEALREAQRRKSEEAKSAQSRDGASPTPGSHGQDQQGKEKNGAVPAVDFTKAQQTMQAVGSKAGAFVNSWAVWAGEKRRAAWGGGKSSSSTTTTTTTNSSGDAPSNNTNSSSSGGVGWASGWVRIGSSSSSGSSNSNSNSNKNRASSPQSPTGGYDALPSQSSDRASIISSASRRSTDASERGAEQRPLNTNRFSAASTSGESMLDDAAAAAAAERASVPPSSLTPPTSPPGKEGSGKSEVWPERGRRDVGEGQQRKNKEEQEEEDGSRSKEEGIERDPKPDPNPKPELESGPEPEPFPTLSPNPAVAEAAEVQELWNRR
ncbi:transport protein Avl9-domain-containing protein [Thermothelomyces heterothallicus CBS 202.75]|uniref:transport protein Avl9-domain-containing protein n=1 Tax=Thermothelomyces heterothallicus CBS 202.75 TaxID=1149848 RepID=UPI003742F21F